ncbi:hypothetical protein [Robertkochia flava]|uniref:hypothetical protein n=1 Tax=Robertkochia flava TaxID=3447986 RepID=UPI001CC9B657|nr:hypothetical protein [Robertkochia marina]
MIKKNGYYYSMPLEFEEEHAGVVIKKKYFRFFVFDENGHIYSNIIWENNKLIKEDILYKLGNSNVVYQLNNNVVEIISEFSERKELNIVTPDYFYDCDLIEYHFHPWE